MPRNSLDARLPYWLTVCLSTCSTLGVRVYSIQCTSAWTYTLAGQQHDRNAVWAMDSMDGAAPRAGAAPPALADVALCKAGMVKDVSPSLPLQ